MKCVALVSGGKDSCFAMMEAVKIGHEIVALANLLPAAPHVQDLDSYMYQTVGHGVLDGYAAAMGLPLYRRRIKGTSRATDLVYPGVHQGDEVEDMAALLAYVQQQHPEVTAVTSGAIASDYQRTRVEHVCARLGLVSLSPLWHRPQGQLLQDMVDSGMHAILIKVAALGLEPTKHLGKSIAALQPYLCTLARRFGSNICGEGGEYETLTLDCPLFVHGAIVLDHTEVVMHDGAASAGVAVLHVHQWSVQPKHGNVECGGESGRVVFVPDEFTVDRAPVHKQRHEEHMAEDGMVTDMNCVVLAPEPVQSQHTRSIACTVTWAPPPTHTDGDTTSSALACVALQRALDHIATAAASTPSNAVDDGNDGHPHHHHGTPWHQALLLTLWIPSMQHFTALNAVYSTRLPAVNPPARACVEIPQGGDGDDGGDDGSNMHRLVVQAVFGLDPNCVRRVLHVQSTSSWAPSCIGPYSQCVHYGGLLWMAGQIGLDPATMQLVGGNSSDDDVYKNAYTQAAQALQSCQAVAVAQRVALHTSAVMVDVYVAGDGDTTPITQHTIAAARDALHTWAKNGSGNNNDSGKDAPNEKHTTNNNPNENHTDADEKNNNHVPPAGGLDVHNKSNNQSHCLNNNNDGDNSVDHDDSVDNDSDGGGALHRGGALAAAAGGGDDDTLPLDTYHETTPPCGGDIEGGMLVNVIVVPQLPRGALVEYVFIGRAPATLSPDDSDDDARPADMITTMHTSTPDMACRRVTHPHHWSCWHAVCSSWHPSAWRAVGEVLGRDAQWCSNGSVRIFYRQDDAAGSNDRTAAAEALCAGLGHWDVLWVPVVGVRMGLDADMISSVALITG